MKKMKRLLAVLLSVLMLLGAVQLFSAAKTGDQTVQSVLPFR